MHNGLPTTDEIAERLAGASGLLDSRPPLTAARGSGNLAV